MMLYFYLIVQCTLDVHAIDELKQGKGIKPTDDSPKYNYSCDEQGKYGKNKKIIKHKLLLLCILSISIYPSNCISYSKWSKLC